MTESDSASSLFVAVIERDVIGGRCVGLKAHAPANDESDGLGLGFPNPVWSKYWNVVNRQSSMMDSNDGGQEELAPIAGL